jgi:hypothetical protein
MRYSNPDELLARPDKFLKLSLGSRDSPDSVELPPILCHMTVRLLLILCGSKFGEVKINSEAYKPDKIRVFVHAGETIMEYIQEEDLAECKELFVQTFEKIAKEVLSPNQYLKSAPGIRHR